MKPLTRIDDNFSSSPQIDVDDLAEIKAAGFKSVICNRPDDEDGGTHDDHALLENVDEVYQEFNDRGATILSPISNKPWGIRDFSVATPDGHRITFGQMIE